MKSNKAIKYRLYPTSEQEIMFLKTFGCCRKIYNLMLEDKIKSYELNKSFGKQTPAMYKEEYEYLKEVDSLALANVQLNLQAAFRNCFDKNRKIKNGFPKYKSRKNTRNSYTTNNQKGTISIIDNKYIRLPKVGNIKAKIHRAPNNDWNIKSATITKESDNKYYISILFEYESSIKQIDINKDLKVIGLDYKSNGLYMDSEGYISNNHKYYKESYKKLLKEQRKLSRMIESHIIDYKVVGNKRYPIYDKELSECKNINKQKIKLAKIHSHIKNQRLDNLHKTSFEIANQFDVVCVENLNMKSLANKGFGNGLATCDNGYGLFLNLLEYKLKDRGKYFIKVDKWFPSSQTCSKCGKTHKLALKDRIYKCNCGNIIDRDLNAAINIKMRDIDYYYNLIPS